MNRSPIARRSNMPVLFIDLAVFLIAEGIFLTTIGKPQDTTGDIVQFFIFALAMLSCARVTLNARAIGKEIDREE